MMLFMIWFEDKSKKSESKDKLKYLELNQPKNQIRQINQRWQLQWNAKYKKSFNFEQLTSLGTVLVPIAEYQTHFYKKN